MKNTLKNQKGYSVIEMVCVLAVISVVAAFFIPNVVGIGNEAKDLKMKENLNSMDTSLTLLIAQGQTFPTTFDEMKTRQIIKSNFDTTGYYYTGTSSAYCLKAELSSKKVISSPNSSCSN